MTSRCSPAVSLIALLALLGAALAVPDPVAANDGPPARIWDLVAGQVGQDVVLSMGISPTDDGISFTVRRESTDGGEDVDLDLTEGDNVTTTGEEPTEICNYYSEPEGFYFEDLCLSHPDLCVDCDEDEVPECFQACETCPTWIPCSDVPQLCTDCDEDGEPECTGGCEPATIWEVTDACVPPGGYSYVIRAETVVGSDMKTVVVAVDDLGFADCADDPDDDDDPDDEGAPEGDGNVEDGGGCSVAARAGAHDPFGPGLLPLLDALLSAS